MGLLTLREGPHLILLLALQLLWPSCRVLELWPVPHHIPGSLMVLVMNHTPYSSLIPHPNLLLTIPVSYLAARLPLPALPYLPHETLAPSFFVNNLGFPSDVISALPSAQLPQTDARPPPPSTTPARIACDLEASIQQPRTLLFLGVAC